MSFDDVNNEIATGNGDWVKLTKREQGTLEGKVVNVQVRNKQFQGKDVISSNTGQPRKEWQFTLDVNGEIKKFAAVESAQFAIRGALNGQKIEPNGVLKIAVTEDSVQGQKSAEYKAAYTPPVAAPAPVEDTDVPF